MNGPALIVAMVWWGATTRPAADAHSFEALHVIAEDGRYGYLDSSGHVAIAPEWSSAWDFSDGMAPVRVGRLHGFIDTSGRMAVSPRFEEVTNFSHGFAAVRLDGLWAFVDKHGEVGGSRFDEVHSFSEGLASVRIGERWGFIDRSLRLVIDTRFEQAWDFTEQLAPVCLGGEWGFIDPQGRIVIEPRFFWVDNFSEGLAWAVGPGGEEGFIDKTGRFVIRRRFWNITPFREGRAWVVLEAGGLYGLIDRTGAVLLQPRFDDARPFSEGLAAVSAEYQWGYVDPAGRTIIAPRFNRAGDFRNGLASVMLPEENTPAYVDREGREVWRQRRKAGGSVRVEPRIANPIYPSRIAGPASRPSDRVDLVGNPLRERFPDGEGHEYSRNVWDMILYEGRIYIGHGDWVENTGPVEVYSFAPRESDFRLEYVAEEEAVTSLLTFDGKLVIPGNDPRESWDLGNFHVKSQGHWQKMRTLPRTLHCFRMAFADGVLAADAATAQASVLFVSPDWGSHWSPVLCESQVESLFAMDGRIHAIDRRGGHCLLAGDILRPSRIVPRHHRLSSDVSMDLWFHRKYSPDNCRAFAGTAVGTMSIGSSIGYGPYPLCVLPAGGSEVAVAEVFGGATVMDIDDRDGILYVLSASRAEGGYRNMVYATSDLKDFRCAAAFDTAGLPRSIVAVDGVFFIGIGCERDENYPVEAAKRSAGDILRVTPSR